MKFTAVNEGCLTYLVMFCFREKSIGLIAQNMAVAKPNLQQVRGSLLGRRNNCYRGFRKGRKPQYAPNGRRIGKQNQSYDRNQFQNYATGQNNEFHRRNAN